MKCPRLGDVPVGERGALLPTLGAQELQPQHASADVCSDLEAQRFEYPTSSWGDQGAGDTRAVLGAGSLLLAAGEAG